MRQSTTIRFLLVIAIAFFPAFQLSLPADAASKPAAAKISSDLLEKIQSAGGTERIPVIIQFKSLTDLSIDTLLSSFGGRIIRALKKLPIRLVDIPLNALPALASRSEVQFISPDRTVGSLGHLTSTTGTDAIRVQTRTTILGITTTTVIDGSGVGVAIIDSGIDGNHAAFENQLGLSRVIASRDFTGENRTDDPFGHGTHVASIAAGNEQILGGAYGGIAPKVSLINLRVLNSQGLGTTASLLAAMDWVMMYHTLYSIRVVNVSLGTPAIDSYLNDPVCHAVRSLSDAGIVVIAAAGNNGKSAAGQKIYGQIHSPGNDPSVITVGASNSFSSDPRGDDTVTTYSSRGPTRSYWTDENGVKRYDNLLKPDLMAPGNRIVAAAGANNYLLASHPELDANVSTLADRRMMYLSGTSMAAPVVTGAAALLLQTNPQLTPGLIKAILMYSAQPLAGSNLFEQGAGEINVAGAIQLANLVRRDLSIFTPLGAPLLTDPAPANQSTFNQETFVWSGGLILNRTYVRGANLIISYQKVYGAGCILGDGIIETSSSQMIDTTKMTGGLTLGENIVTSDGTSLGNGPSFLALGFLFGDGIILADGIMIGDGIMVGDGVMVGDTFLQGQSVLTGGD